MSSPFASLATAGDGESVHHVYQTDEKNLIEKSLKEEQWSLPKVLGPAKAGTAAAAYFVQELGVVVSLNAAGNLQDHVYNSEEEEWEDGTLSSLNINAHAESKLGITVYDELIHLFYQTPSGAIAQATYDSETWESSKELSVPKPTAGASFCVASAEDKSLHLSYSHQDGSLHRSTYQNRDWTDTTIGKTTDGAPPVRILAVLDSSHICYRTGSGDLVEVDNAGTHQKVASINSDGEVQKLGGEECGRFSGGRDYHGLERLVCALDGRGEIRIKPGKYGDRVIIKRRR